MRRRRVVGQLQVTLEWSDWRNGWFWWIQSVYVRADHRGTGSFALCTSTSITRRRRRGMSSAFACTWSAENTAAQATYSRIGMSFLPYMVLEEPCPRSQLPK